MSFSCETKHLIWEHPHSFCIYLRSSTEHKQLCLGRRFINTHIISAFKSCCTCNMKISAPSRIQKQTQTKGGMLRASERERVLVTITIQTAVTAVKAVTSFLRDGYAHGRRKNVSILMFVWAGVFDISLNSRHIPMKGGHPGSRKKRGRAQRGKSSGALTTSSQRTNKEREEEGMNTWEEVNFFSRSFPV